MCVEGIDSFLVSLLNVLWHLAMSWQIGSNFDFKSLHTKCFERQMIKSLKKIEIVFIINLNQSLNHLWGSSLSPWLVVQYYHFNWSAKHFKCIFLKPELWRFYNLPRNYIYLTPLGPMSLFHLDKTKSEGQKKSVPNKRMKLEHKTWKKTVEKVTRKSLIY